METASNVRLEQTFLERFQYRESAILPTYCQQINFDFHPTQKHYNFIAESINIKPVTGLLAISKVLREPLDSMGYSRATNDVLRNFYDLGRDEAQFTHWLKASTGVKRKPAEDCYRDVTILINDYFLYFLNIFNFLNLILIFDLFFNL